MSKSRDERVNMAMNSSVTQASVITQTDGTTSICGVFVRDLVSGAEVASAKGLALRHPDDPHVPRRGINLATARAFANLAAQYQENADTHMYGDPRSEADELEALRLAEEARAACAVHGDHLTDQVPEDLPFGGPMQMMTGEEFMEMIRLEAEGGGNAG